MITKILYTMKIKNMKWFLTLVENLSESIFWKEMNKKTMKAAIIQGIKLQEHNQNKVILREIIKKQNLKMHYKKLNK